MITMTFQSFLQQREKQLAIQQGNELLAAVSPMGNGWSIGIDAKYFRTHTVCQRCDSLFDTTDPDDKCRGNYYHTFTPKLHRIICLAAEKRFGKKPPKLFIPNIIKTPYEKYVRYYYLFILINFSLLRWFLCLNHILLGCSARTIRKRLVVVG